MSLLTRYQEWRAARLRKKKSDSFQAGYGYARACMRSGMEKPEAHLRNLVETASIFGDWNEFDQGILDFLQRRP